MSRNVSHSSIASSVRAGLFAFLKSWQLGAAYVGLPQHKPDDLAEASDRDPALAGMD